ncbi:hypothetical protein C789_1494 [Microcystis aeruginosa FACHB-905 = DIANCHI905]|nr:hypothetical protein C789_1494 [Microcystis aeruginosa FACHB-905 = DIANCHI905]
MQKQVKENEDSIRFYPIFRHTLAQIEKNKDFVVYGIDGTTVCSYN